VPTSDGKTPPVALDLSIDELEALLAAARRNQATPEAAIPVLDDEVPGPTPVIGPAPAAPAPGSEERLTPRQLVELGQRLQQRLDSELEELADVIRNVVKRCLLEELRRELPPPGGGAAANPDRKDPA
jgi:hypothetical protein